MQQRLAVWLNGLQNFKNQVQALYSEIEARHRQQALIEFARGSIITFAEGLQRYQSMPENFLYLNQSLYLLVRGTRSLSKITALEKMQLDQLLIWLESNLEH